MPIHLQNVARPTILYANVTLLVANSRRCMSCVCLLQWGERINARLLAWRRLGESVWRVARVLQYEEFLSSPPFLVPR